MISVTSLPPDLLYHFTLTYLPSESIFALDRCNRYLHLHLSKSITHDFWKDLYYRDLTEYPSPYFEDFRIQYFHGMVYCRKGDNIFHRASMNGFEKMVHRVLTETNPPSSVCEDEMQVAAIRGHLHVIKMIVLMRPGTDINTSSPIASPLGHAIICKHDHIAKWIIRKGANTRISFTTVTSEPQKERELQDRLRDIVNSVDD